MNIPVAKTCLTEKEAKSAYDTILTGWVTQGPRVKEFEEKFAEYVGAEFSVAVSSCTTALHLAMIVAGIKKGHEVICPSMSFIATANSIMHAGARPVFAEINPVTYNIDLGHAESLITNKTRAILIVHQMGMPVDIEAFSKLCKKNKIKLIEDAACAVGSTYKGGKIGSHSDLVCFSFHPRKVITTGDGGMIATSNKDYYDRLRVLRQQGMSVNDMVRHASSKVIFEAYSEVGYNYRMTDIQAAVGIKQLERLDWIISERRKIAMKYHESLKDINCLRLPLETKGYFSNYQSYCVYLKKNSPVSRNDLMQKLLDDGISTRRGIMTAHREPAYKEYNDSSLPISEDASDRSIILPLYVPMPEDEVNFIVNRLKRYLR